MGAHRGPSETLDSIAAWAAALCAASCVERYAMRSCMRCWLNSSMARRAYSDLLKPARLASTAMLRAKSLGMRSEKVVNDSMARIVLLIVRLSSITSSNTLAQRGTANQSPDSARPRTIVCPHDKRCHRIMGSLRRVSKDDIRAPKRHFVPLLRFDTP